MFQRRSVKDLCFAVFFIYKRTEAWFWCTMMLSHALRCWVTLNREGGSKDCIPIMLLQTYQHFRVQVHIHPSTNTFKQYFYTQHYSYTVWNHHLGAISGSVSCPRTPQNTHWRCWGWSCQYNSIRDEKYTYRMSIDKSQAKVKEMYTELGWSCIHIEANTNFPGGTVVQRSALLPRSK